MGLRTATALISPLAGSKILNEFFAWGHAANHPLGLREKEALVWKGQMDHVSAILTESWEVLADSAPYGLFGFFVAGLIQIFMNKERIVRHIGSRGVKSVFMTALFGIPLPLCSCGVIPAAVSLRRRGASRGATMSFMISTPETGVDSIAISYAMLDPLMMVFRPFAAFVTAVASGIAEDLFPSKEAEKKVLIPDSACPVCADTCTGDDCNAQGHSFGFRFRQGMHYAFGDLLGEVGPWLLLGILIAGVISAMIPEHIVEEYIGSGILAMLVMLGVGIPMYICASASTPIAAALILKGLSPGAALVFLLAGPATNAATMIAVGKYLGKRSLAVYLLGIAICSVTLGLLLDWLYDHWEMDATATIGKAGEIFPETFKVGAGVLLIVCVFIAWLHWRRRKKGHGDCG